MSDLFQFGCHRVLEPANSFPQPAWKLDNTMSVHDNEMLVDVRIINVNSTSFSQIYNAVNGNPLEIKNRILEIVRSRGKLQNPITGTGGILYGRVEKIGKDYPNPFGLCPGDMVITLASLSLTPLRIDTIEDMDIFSGQLIVQGKAILFDHMPLVKVDPRVQSGKYSLELLISVMDEAGAPRQTWKLANPHDNVLIMGANGKLGLLCAHAAREKMGSTGKITGIVNTRKSKKNLENTAVYDVALCCDAFNTVEAIDSLSIEKIGSFDLIINCMTVSGSEMLSLVLTRNKGTIFFASLANSHKITALTSESMGKDLNLIGYTGFVEGHAVFTTQLLDNHPDLIRLLSQLYKRQEIQYADKTPLVFGSREIEHILKDSGEDYVFVSSKIQEVLSSAVNVAKYDCTTLITGESGVGKEIIADIIHKASERNHHPLIKINCGTIPANLLESELFGYEKGAFSGASEKGKKGFFELAHNGTLFLDEVGELKMELQVKILRAIQEKQIYRVGGTRPITVNVRIITATNRSLEEMIKNGGFREDLFYRLNVFPIKIPSLKHRKKDIIPLVEHFIKKYNTKFKLHKTIEQMALENLVGHDWPGNIRELQNIVQRILINTKGDHITLVDTIRELSSTHPDKKVVPCTGGLNIILDQTEFKILRATKEKYKTTRKMAQTLGLSQTTLVRKLKKHQL
ncbi:MAG: AAA family ATPase [Desulfobacteraceae bacterium]|nr:AAA family ATPase [Desulfobacteraceae bacterium]